MESQLLKISKKITQILSRHVILDNDQKEIIAYQLRVKISEILMFLVMFIVALTFKRHWAFCLSYLSMRLSRSHIGGIHRKTYRGCCIHTLIFFTIALVVSEYIYNMQIELFMPIFCVIDVVFAPCPSKERGEYGNKARLRMKMFALLGLLICLILCVILPQYKNIILVTLVMVHIEFMVKYMRERRQRCLNGCANIS